MTHLRDEHRISGSNSVGPLKRGFAVLGFLYRSDESGCQKEDMDLNFNIPFVHRYSGKKPNRVFNIYCPYEKSG